MPPTKDKAKKPKVAAERSHVTTKKPKTPKAAKNPSKPSGLSEEKVVDSDSEGTTPEPKSKPKTTLKQNEREKKAKKKEALPKQPPPPPPPKEPSPSSSDDDEDSSEEIEETEQPKPKKPEITPRSVNGVKRKADESSSEDPSSGVESKEEQPMKKLKTGGDVDMDDASSGEDSSDEDEESDESSSKTEIAKPSQSQPAALSTKTLQSLPPPPFDPPEGFVSVTVSQTAAGSIFSSRSLAGKQLWLLSAPSNLPISSIEEVAMQAVQDGSTVLQHKGIEYVLAEDKDRKIQFQSVLLPGQSGYQTADVKVERALRLQQKVELPDLSKLQANTQTGSDAAGDVARAAVSTVRPQPPGLKMRYKPPGFGPEDPGLGSGSEDEGQTANEGFRFPKSLRVHGASDKPAVRNSKKKEKKVRKSEDEEMISGNMPPPITTPLKKKRKDKVEKTPQRPSTSASVESAGSEQKETKEERRRKKQLKKEGKQKT